MFKLKTFCHESILKAARRDFYELHKIKQVNSAVKNKKLQKSIEIVNEMNSKGIKPKNEIYNNILQLSNQVRRIKTGKKLLEDHNVELGNEKKKRKLKLSLKRSKIIFNFT